MFFLNIVARALMFRHLNIQKKFRRINTFFLRRAGIFVNSNIMVAFEQSAENKSIQKIGKDDCLEKPAKYQ